MTSSKKKEKSRVRPHEKAKPADKAKPSPSKPKALGKRPSASGAPPAGTPAAAKHKTAAEHSTTHMTSTTSSPSTRKGSRKSLLAQRRGPNGEPFVAGDILLPHGPQSEEETQYFFRGCAAAEDPLGDLAVNEILSKRGLAGDRGLQGDLQDQLVSIQHRFQKAIEPTLPMRATMRRTWPGVVERAKGRRREIGAFLRGLDLGGTEPSHMDAHGEASLLDLMKWAARLENLADADEPDQVDYAQFHRGLDQLDSTTEALIVDVELTLKRLRDRTR